MLQRCFWQIPKYEWRLQKQTLKLGTLHPLFVNYPPKNAVIGVCHLHLRFAITLPDSTSLNGGNPPRRLCKSLFTLVRMNLHVKPFSSGFSPEMQFYGYTYSFFKDFVPFWPKLSQLAAVRIWRPVRNTYFWYGRACGQYLNYLALHSDEPSDT